MPQAQKKLIVLLIGKGGREQAFAWSLLKSLLVSKVLCVPGNGGTAQCGSKVENAPNTVSSTDYAALVEYAKLHGVNFVVLSSKNPLVNGAEKYFREAGIKFLGPSYEAARLEGSKCFVKDFMGRHGIPTADYRNFNDYEAAKAYIKTVSNKVVIKASGLAAGKGVLMLNNALENIAALDKMMLEKEFGDSGANIVIEDLLVGDKISITFLSDGQSLRIFPAGQDAQRILDGNLDANTGGMGVYAPTPLLTEQQLDEIDRSILQPTIAGIRKDGHPFVGLICIGLIMSSTGPKLLEYNVRFGDPEAQTLLLMLDDESDFAEIMLACTEKRLHQVHMSFVSEYAASVVVAFESYPHFYRKENKINVGPIAEGTLLFHAGTELDNGTLVTNRSRVMAAVCIKGTLDEAVYRAYEGVKNIYYKGKYFRKDIGKVALALLATQSRANQN